MSVASLLDNRTLLICLWMGSFLFALAFARTWRAHPGLRGAGFFSLAFLSAALSCLLFAVVPAVTPMLLFLNTVVGDTLVTCVYAFLLAGTERFFGVRRTTPIGWLVVALAAVLLFFFTELHDSMLVRIVILGVVGCLLRILIAVQLLLQNPRRHQRTLVAVMLLYALFSLGQAVGTLLHGAPRDYMRSDVIQTATLFLNLVFILATGLLLFLMLNDELVYRLEEEAARDFMSGTLNRRGIERALRADMERSRRHKAPLSVALLDLDFFKQINDTLGHAAGDSAILTVAHAITRSLRAYDHVGRFGGDEFLLILPDTPPTQAAVVIKRIREDVSRTVDNPLTLSIGLTSMVPAGEDAASLLARVDEALYAAKNDGRNCTRERLPS
jgi:diguanylate cyclase (GGDEF)-like protein